MPKLFLRRLAAFALLGCAFSSELPAAPVAPEGYTAAKPGSPRHRFRNDPDHLPGVQLVPQKPGAFERPGAEPFDRFDRWLDGQAPAGDGAGLARARREAMRKLIEKDPREALRRALRPDVRARLPAPVAADVEETVRGIGSLMVVCALPTNHAAEIEIQREVLVNGKRYRAFTHGKRLDQLCAQATPIFGVALGDVLALDEMPYRRLDRTEAQRAARDAGALGITEAHTGVPLALEDIAGAIDEGDRIAYFGSDASLSDYFGENWTPYIAEFGGSAGGPGAASTWTQGTRRFVAYRARLAEDATNYEPFAYSSGVTAYNTCSNWFYQWSYGSCTMQFVVVTNVYVFTNSGAWYEANGGWPKLLADSRTASLGTPEAYTNFNFDSVTHNWNVGLSGYAGVAYVGGRGASFHEGYGANDGVVGHEYGHNLGLPHNNFWDTGGHSIIGAGTHVEYGNDYDIMGNGYADWPFAANMRNRLSWLPDMHAHYNVTAGVHRIQAFDQFPLFLPDTNAPVACYTLAMPRDGRNYVFEFRQDTGRIGANQNFLNGVLLEIDGGFGGGPELLDCTPGSLGGKTDAALTIGRMFSDPSVNLHVTPVARGPTATTNWIDLVVHRNTQLSNHPPVLAVSASSYTTAVGVAIALTATAADADGDELAYYWEFGDGAVSYNNTNVQAKSWSTAGVYAVRCVAADMRGREAAAQILITVGAPGTRYRIGGRVTSSAGAPVQGVRIAGGTGPAVYSDLDGRFTVPNLAAGSYTMAAFGADTYGNGFTFTYHFGNPVTVGPDQTELSIYADTATGTNVGSGSGFLYERWDGIAGTAISALTNDPTYPNQPDDQRVMKSAFEAPTDRGDNYGTRLRAIYTAPLNGLYTFYIASDDNSELWFSPTTNPATATRIANVPGWTGSRSWTTYTNQKSAAIALAAGQKCYIEALQKEGTGGDHLAIGADLPGGSQERPIPYHRLDPWPIDASTPPTLIAIAASDAAATEPGIDAGEFTLTRTGDISADQTVTFQLTGTAQYDVDYLPTGLTALFLAGDTQTVVAITPRDDALSEPAETVVATLVAGPDFGIDGTASATVAIGDNEATTVTVSAPDALATEPSDPGLFVVTRTGVSTGSIVVGLSATGTASNGVDFTALPSSVTIPAGSSTAAVVVSPIADGITELAETVTLSALGGAGYAVGTASNATVTVGADPGPGTGILREWWNGISGTLVSDLTSHSNYPAAPSGSEIRTNYFEGPVDSADNYGQRFRGYFAAPVAGAYRFYIASDDQSELWLGTNSDAATAVRIAYVNGYTASREWAKFTNQQSAAITLAAGQTYYIEARMKEGSGGDNLAVGAMYPGGYLERPVPFHRLLPYDTQKPTVSLVASDSSAGENGNTGAVLVTRSVEGIAGSLTVGLVYGGTATPGTDYAALPTQVVFSAGVTNVWLALTPIDDTLAEGIETAIVSIVDNVGSFFTAAASNATIAIEDDDIPTISVATTSPYAYEAGPTSSTFVLTRSGAAANPVAINYALSGTATPGSDFAPPPSFIATTGSVTLAAGQLTTNLVIVPASDTASEGPETVTLQLSGDPLYTLGAPASATITILDDDVAPTVVVNSPAAGNINIPPGVGLILDATVLHNGLPSPPSGVTQVWTQIAGPSNAFATLTTSNDWKNAAATFPTIGTFVLRLTASAGSQSASTNVTVSVGTFNALAWTTAVVGAISPAPVFISTNGTNRITSAGKPGVVGGSTTDNFAFAMVQLSGNCSITARVVSVQNIAGTNSFGGVMMRESLAPDAKSVSMGMRASTARSRFTTRATNGQASVSVNSGGQSFPYWVRLVRTGNVFSAYYSSSGATWTQLGSSTTIAMSNAIYVGLAASSGTNGVAGTAVFDRVGLVATALAANVGAFVSAGPPSMASLPSPATLAGSATDDGQPNPPGALAFAWSKVSGPGGVAFANPAATNTTAAFDTPGNYALRLVAHDGQIRTFNDTTVTATGLGVRIVATDAYAASPGTNTGTFTITRDGPTNASLAVNLNIGGTALGGVDYILLSTQAVIAAGESNVAVTISPVDFLVPRDTVTVVIAIATSANYAVEAQSSDTVFLANTNPSLVSVVATDPNASEPPGAADPGAFLFTREGGTSFPLTVTFDVLGTAISGVDFVPLTNTFTFAPGVTNAVVLVVPIDHTYGSAPLSVMAALVATSGSYAATAASNAMVTITNRNFFALHLVWRGTTNNLWDLATSPNWFATDTAAPDTVFSNGYSVAFDDSPGVATNIALASGLLLSPADIVVSNNVKGFAITGSGGLVGTCGILKAGSQPLVLGGSSNTFAGAVTVAQGVLVAATTNALGATTGTTRVDAGGTLDVNGLNLGGERVAISGAGFDGLGAIINSGPPQIQALQYLALAGDASIGGQQRWDVRAGSAPVVNLNGFTLTKTGTNYIALVSAAVTNGGHIVVDRGTLAVSVNTTVSGPGTITVNAGGTLAPGNFGGATALLKPITLNGGTLAQDAGSTGATVSAAITLNAGPFTNAFLTPDAGMFITNTIGGAGALTKLGANTVILTATNTWMGGTLVSAGMVQISNSGRLPGNVTNHGTIVFSRADASTFDGVLSGTGRIVQAGAGVTRLAAFGSTLAGTNVVAAGALHFAGGSFTATMIPNGRNFNVQGGASLVVTNDALVALAGSLNLGTASSSSGHLIQYSGTLAVNGSGDTASRAVMVGEYPSENSSFNLLGGVFAATNGITYLPWNAAQGLWNIQGGTASVRQIHFNNGTTGTGTLNLAGGRINVGPAGVTQSGGSAVINLGGGILGAYASWTSTLPMALTGSNGNTTVDTATNTIALTGSLIGTGGLTKVGAGVLSLPSVHSFAGGLLVSNGTVLLNGRLSASGADIASGGTLAGTGSLAGAVANRGVVAPASTNVGTLMASNAYVQSASGTLQIQLASNAQDRLAVSGIAALGGTLQVSLLGSFIPATGTAFTVLTAGSVSGGFAVTNLPALPTHRSWTVTYTATSVVLGVGFANTPPLLTVPGPHVLALGATTNFTVAASDADGDAMTVTNTLRPAGATFTNGLFTWTATLANWNSTNSIVFVAADGFGGSTTNGSIIVVPYDADGDGLPDHWEWSHLATLTNDAAGDLVGKGNTLLEDFIAGTDPTNRNSLFRAVQATGTPTVVSVPTVSGRLYRIWFTDDALEAAPAWLLFGSQDNGIGSWLETNPPPTLHGFADDFSPATTGHVPTNGTRFYRLDVRMAP